MHLLNFALVRYLLGYFQELTIREVDASRLTAVRALLGEVEAMDALARYQCTAIPTCVIRV